MNGRLGRWRAALRIARRGVLRARGRSALVAVMVGLPVGLASGVAVLTSTAELNGVERLPSTLGRSQALITPIGRGPVFHGPDPFEGSGSSGEVGTPWTAGEVLALTGGRLVPVDTARARLGTERGALPETDVLQLDTRDPATSGMVDLVDGRLPRADTEIAVGMRLHRRGVEIGDRLVPDAAPALTVVGTVADERLDGAAVVLPTARGFTRPEFEQTSWLLGRDEPARWEEVLRLNRAGLQVTSRAVVLNPPPAPAIPPEAQNLGADDAAFRLFMAIAITAIVIEVVLLAGPAMAVSARRKRRQLALLVAGGGDRPDVRRVVLAEALVLGAAAAVLGALLGVAGAGAGKLLADWYRPGALGPFDVVWWQVAAAAALGALAAVLAAWAPARQAARADVVAALTGRRGQVRSRAGWPLVGAAMVAAGSAMVFTLGARPGGEYVVAAGTLVTVLGAVAAMPWLVGVLGRLSRRLPLPLRMATRDAARNRGRTAPAAAAVMGAVAGVTVLAIGSASDFEQSRQTYTPQEVPGTTTMWIDPSEVPVTATGSDLEGVWEQVDEVTGRVLPGARFLRNGALEGLGPFAAVGHGAVPTKTTELYIAAPGCPQVRVGSEPFAMSEDCMEWQTIAAGQAAPIISSGYGGNSVMDASALRARGYRVGPTERAVLAGGGVLVHNTALIRPDGTLPLTVYTYESTNSGDRVTSARTTRVKAAPFPDTVAPAPGLSPIPLVMTPATAEELRVPWQPTRGVLTGVNGTISTEQQDRLEEALGAIPAVSDESLYTERGFVETFTFQFLALLIAAVLAVLIGTLTATGLALADARPDFATLSAVGAGPRTRRLMAGAHALTIALLGTVVGIAVGFVPGLAVTWPLTSDQYSGAPARTGPVIDVPWLLLLGVGVVVPVFAALVMAATTRSRLPIVRRLGE